MALTVVKRSGDRQPFDRSKVAAGVRSATKGRPPEVSNDAAIDDLASAVEDALRLDGRMEVSSEEVGRRSDEHTSELQSLMRISYAVFCLKKKIEHVNSLQ